MTHQESIKHHIIIFIINKPIEEVNIKHTFAQDKTMVDGLLMDYLVDYLVDY